MRAYYATKLSPNISRMLNGFLVCKNVPIARTGTHDYRGSEIGKDEQPDTIFQVHREESEVFSPAALASFEGVSFVDEHPPGEVTVENAGLLSRGFVKDVLRGAGEDSDKVVVDIIITDPNTIAEIDSGKREVSCGYNCDYETDAEGRMFQRNIRGNHVALVGKGRAGKSVAIKDAEPDPPATKNERRAKYMKQPKGGKTPERRRALSNFFSILNIDAEPDDLAEIASHLMETAEEAAEVANELAAPEASAPPAEEEKPADEGAEEKDSEAVPPWAAEIIARLGKLEAALESAKTPDSDPLDELEEELASGEESVTVPAEEIDESEEDEAALDTAEEPVDEDPEDEDPEDEEPGKTGASDARDAISKAKAQVSKIKDAKTRRAVSDAMAGLIRQTYGIKPTTPKGSYGAILNAKRQNAKKAKDSLATFDNMEERQAAYDKRNPHNKTQGGN